MADFDEQLDRLCRTANWSVEDVSNFFGVSKTTVYCWHRGKTVPSREVQAIMEVFCREVRARWRCSKKREFERWVDRMAQEGVVGYVHRMARPREEDGLFHMLACRARREHGLVIETACEKPLALVVPFTAKALEVFTERMLCALSRFRSATDESSPASSVSVPSVSV